MVLYPHPDKLETMTKATATFFHITSLLKKQRRSFILMTKLVHHHDISTLKYFANTLLIYLYNDNPRSIFPIIPLNKRKKSTKICRFYATLNINENAKEL
jgi:hypothetical protein